MSLETEAHRLTYNATCNIYNKNNYAIYDILFYSIILYVLFYYIISYDVFTGLFLLSNPNFGHEGAVSPLHQDDIDEPHLLISLSRWSILRWPWDVIVFSSAVMRFTRLAVDQASQDSVPIERRTESGGGAEDPPARGAEVLDQGSRREDSNLAH